MFKSLSNRKKKLVYLAVKKSRNDIKIRKTHFSTNKCEINKLDLDFFEKYIPNLSIFFKGGTICDSISVHILNKLFTARERKNYSITKYIGCGSSGYVMDVLYSNFYGRSVETTEKNYILKLIPISKSETSKQDVILNNKCKIRETYMIDIKNEINMQKSLVEILKFKSNDLIMIPAIIKEKELKAYNLYAVLMEKIPSTYKSFPTSFGLSRQQNIIDKHKKFIFMMVHVVSQLHELDFTHGDVAYRNLFYNEEEGKIALIDFGRSVYIKNLSLYNQYMFKMYDYYCILNEIFRDNSSILNDDYVSYLSDCLQTALLKQKVFDNLNSSHLSDEKEKSIFRKFRDNLLKPADKASLELKISSADKFKKDKILKDEETDKYIHISVLRKKWSDPHGPYEDTLNSDFWGVRY